MLTAKRYENGHWWIRLGRFTVGSELKPAYVGLAEREGWVRVWRFGRWSATYERAAGDAPP